ncbi:hypothetical protein KTR10_02745 [Candidatus Kaiserbacteria bacterium]|nr:hypothetical protein [Candidatus Kaiserbacteria bacterium]
MHTRYEKLFWQSYMGDHSIDPQFEKAQIAREKFRTDTKRAHAVQEALKTANGTEKKKLMQWAHFFETFQTPEHLKPLFAEITELETKILKKQTSRKEGYIHPKTKKFVRASRAQMQDIMTTHDDERIRKACFVALEGLAQVCVEEFIELVGLRNKYAQELGYEDFYAYKAYVEERMSKAEIFKIFDTIYEKTKYAFKDLRKMEKKMPGLRKPWNRGYLLAGDFTKESDQYFPFEEALTRWGTSFARLGISYQGGTLQLDLLDRKGKYENGFCHWPDVVYFEKNKRIPGSANFTCNVTYGQVGSAEDGYNTLFHEGGHAAHLLNTEETEACVNNEYPPASTAWAETQSMFLDSMLSSVEWASRYAKNAERETYPFSLYEREVRKLHALNPLSMNGISSVMEFERRIYEEKKLSKTKVLKIAKEVFTKYTDTAVPSLRLLSIPHIYSWESSCSYHGYGLALLSVAQWREYFYKKYGYIVDNPRVGKEMKAMWKYGSALPLQECVRRATGKKLTPAAYIKNITLPLEKILNRAKKRIKTLETVPDRKKVVKLNATIKMVHGKKVVATNKKSFEDMAETYAQWLETQRVKS